MNFALPLLLGSVCAAAPRPDAKAELAMLQGTWEMVAAEEDGAKLSPEDRAGKYKDTVLRKLVVEKGKFRFWLAGRERPAPDVGLFELDVRKEPAVVRWRWSRDDKEVKYAIVSAEGDTLRICVDKDDPADRARLPKEFKTRKGDGRYLYVLKRAKE